jgi:hypothetical protein
VATLERTLVRSKIDVALHRRQAQRLAGPANVVLLLLSLSLWLWLWLLLLLLPLLLLLLLLFGLVWVFVIVLALSSFASQNMSQVL